MSEENNNENVLANDENAFSVRIPPQFFEKILTENAKTRGEIANDEYLEIYQMFYDEESGYIGFNGVKKKIILN